MAVIEALNKYIKSSGSSRFDDDARPLLNPKRHKRVVEDPYGDHSISNALKEKHESAFISPSLSSFGSSHFTRDEEMLLQNIGLSAGIIFAKGSTL